MKKKAALCLIIRRIGIDFEVSNSLWIILADKRTASCINLTYEFEGPILLNKGRNGKISFPIKQIIYLTKYRILGEG